MNANTIKKLIVHEMKYNSIKKIIEGHISSQILSEIKV